MQRLQSPYFFLVTTVLVWFSISAGAPQAAQAAADAQRVAYAEPRYVGGTTCAGCHPRESEAWRGSHHDLAMQEPTDKTVLGDFKGTKFSHKGVVSTFFKRGDTF